MKIVCIIEFIAVFYTFSFVFEFILLPVAIFLSVLLEYLKGKDENKMVENILTYFMAIIGLFLLTYATYRIISDPISFFNLETLNDFYLPPLLSILFFPYVFAMIVYVRYENAFVGLKFKIEDDAVRAFAKRRAVFSFRADTNTLKRWSVHIFRGQITSRDDVVSTIREIQNLQSREANPEDIPFEQGWSPYRAKEFLSDVGLPTDYYRKAV